MVRIEYDKNIDTVNVEIFGRTGTDNCTERRYRCVCCIKPVCIDESYSSRGHRMICGSCFWKYFNGDILSAHKWMKEGDHDGN